MPHAFSLSLSFSWVVGMERNVRGGGEGSGWASSGFPSNEESASKTRFFPSFSGVGKLGIQ